MATRTAHSLLAYKLGVPIAMAGTLSDTSTMGVPSFISVSPQNFMVHKINLTFTERLANLGFILFGVLMPSPFISSAMVNELVPGKPHVTINELHEQTQLYLVDQDPILDYPKSSMPHVQYVGGLSVSEGKPLPDDFQRFMDGASNGAIIVSFGSVMELSEDRLDVLIKSIESVSGYRVVFKYKGAKELKSSQNMLVSKWIPQNDLLAHPNTRLFVTHCGNNGQHESLFHGVPMLGIPLGADQYGNCKRIKDRAFGLCLNAHEFTVEEFANSIELMLKGEYDQRIKHASRAFRNQALPGERAAFHIDHLIKYGGEYYRDPSIGVSCFQLYSIDIITLICCIFLLILYLLKKMCSFLYKRCIPSRKEKLH